MDILAEDQAGEPPRRFVALGKVVDYIKDHWVLFAFLATIVIVLIASIMRDDFSLLYFIDEVAFQQTELDFKKKVFSHKAEQYEREHRKKLFELNQVKELVKHANSLLDVGRYAAAAQVFEEAVKLDPTHREASRDLLNARIYQQVAKQPGQSTEYDPVVAYQRIEFLLLQDRDDPYALVARANMHLDVNPEAAGQDLDRALRISPTLAEAHRLLAAIYLRRKDPPRALAEIQKALKLSPWDVRYLETEAQIYEAHGDFNDAVNSLRTAHQLDPDYISVLFASANLYLRHGHRGALVLQAELIARLENQVVVNLPKNAVPYRFPAGSSHVWLYSVVEKRHYAYQNMALLAAMLEQESERYIDLLRRLELPDRSHLKLLLHHHVSEWQAKSNEAVHRRLGGIREDILQAIKDSEREARMRQAVSKSAAGEPKCP